MKKLVLLSIVSAGILGLMNSCGMTSSAMKITTRNNRTNQINNNPILTFPLVMDLEVDMTKKVKGTATGNLSFGVTEEYYKELALGQAIINANCDVLIEPTFLVTKNLVATSKGQKTSVEVEVSGYPGKYKNPRNVSAADTTMIKFVSKMINGNVTKTTVTTVPATMNNTIQNGRKIY